MKPSIQLLLSIVFFSCTHKELINYEILSLELDSMLTIDQKCRKELTETQQIYGWNTPELKPLIDKMHHIDSSNLQRVLEIIDLVGEYPGKSLVGEPANNATFYILQHAPDSIQDAHL